MKFRAVLVAVAAFLVPLTSAPQNQGEQAVVISAVANLRAGHDAPALIVDPAEVSNASHRALQVAAGAAVDDPGERTVMVTANGPDLKTVLAVLEAADAQREKLIDPAATHIGAGVAHADGVTFVVILLRHDPPPPTTTTEATTTTDPPTTTTTEATTTTTARPSQIETDAAVSVRTRILRTRLDKVTGSYLTALGDAAARVQVPAPVTTTTATTAPDTTATPATPEPPDQLPWVWIVAVALTAITSAGFWWHRRRYHWPAH